MTAGHRGALLAISADKTQAVILGLTDDLHGMIYLVREDQPNQYPRTVRKIGEIPKGFSCHPVMADASNIIITETGAAEIAGQERSGADLMKMPDPE